MQPGDLYIAEKPSLAAAIAAGLPGTAVKTRTHIAVGDITVTWLFGHMYELAMPDDYDEAYAKWDRAHLPIIPDVFKRKPRKDAAAQLTAIKAMLKTAKRVVHAGDPDAEGQLLVDELLEEARSTKPVMRVLVNEYTPSKVRAALAALRPNTDPQFVGWSSWAYCRSVLDWMYGLNLTRLFTLIGRDAGHDGVLSVGRVQTPVVALVVNRDIAIETFRPMPFQELRIRAVKQNAAIDAKWKPREGQPGLDNEGRLVDPLVAADLVRKLTNQQATVVQTTTERKTQGAPLPFTMSALQVAADKAFGYGANETLEIAQSLYDPALGLTTYPRTDSPYLSMAQHQEAPGRLAALANNLPELRAAHALADPRRVSPGFSDAKAEGKAHHGIIPTDTTRDISALSEKQRNVYELIAKNYLAQFLPAHEYDQSSITLSASGELFEARGRVPIANGWKMLQAKPDDEDAEGDESESRALPAVTKGESLSIVGAEAKNCLTTAPKPFTEASLVQAMSNIAQYVTNPQAKQRLREGQGIGTEATRGPMLEELKKRKILERKGKQIRSTPAARALIAAVPPIATDAGFTGMTEQSLDAVAAGRVPKAVFITKMSELVTKLVHQAADTTMKIDRPAPIACPACKQGELKLRSGTNGKFWSCSRYQEGCKATFENKRGNKPDLAGGKGSRTGKPASRTTTAKKAATKKAPTKRAPSRKAAPKKDAP